jgi:hypothetical protein
MRLPMKKESKYRFQWMLGMIAAAILLGVSGFSAPGMCGEPSAATAVSSEEPAVLEAAQKYFDAEMARDLPAVYRCLAPSSAYSATHDYEAFLAEAKASPVRILAYKIVRIAHIRNNEDFKGFPKVEKFAYVEVDIVVHYTDKNEKADVNFGFTFIKERGKWYKG